ncbi:DUF6387 family protein [Colwellia sp. PAMC 21821]|uniref:DUF6387 family protein n=1 Tax=Colwellia sp. PAMC 21821 TaxID=1816219 RepID=UPI0009BD0D4C|nr:DUF6387 family protein [Colwellia sp. PAMC 21821]ARD44436.1 hypothetical protein A3Q33_09030 [Colwellia sp. PAMC 21821]
MMINLEDELTYLDWFSLKNYEVLRELNLKDFFNELSFRLKLFESLYDDFSSINIFPNCPEWQSILAGNILVTKQYDEDPKCKCIKSTYGISVVSKEDLEMYSSTIELSQELAEPKEDPFIPHKCHVCEDFSLNFYDSETVFDELLLKVDLRSNTDKEIHAGLDLIIREFRRKMHTLEPDNKVTGVSEAYIKTAIVNNLIPYIDLRLWAVYCSSLGKPMVFSGADTKDFIPSLLIDVESKKVKKVSISSIKKMLFPTDVGYEEKSDKYVTSELPDLLNRYLDDGHYRKAKYYIHSNDFTNHMIVKDLF